ncbi:MAG TPA: hypothetical protein VMR86_05295, partial [Myxococcota bacterium]|nr:hypothetical protein [Myxococcota bacterium]
MEPTAAARVAGPPQPAERPVVGAERAMSFGRTRGPDRSGQLIALISFPARFPLEACTPRIRESLEVVPVCCDSGHVFVQRDAKNSRVRAPDALVTR